MSNTYERAAPQQVGWLNSLPSQNFGEFYFTVRLPWPLSFIKKEYRQNAIGQLCDGTSRKWQTEWQMYHKFPNHGAGYTYVSWRAVPDYPDRCKNALSGTIDNPQPFDGKRP